MICPAREAPHPTADWRDLADELECWAEQGREATLWWRDDDATAATPQLDRLLGLAGEVPVALAVIPAVADPALAELLARRPRVVFLQHGWRHLNHAPAGGKKSEFPPDRPAADVADDLVRGRARLAALLGERALSVLAPPWNRFAACFLPLLRDCGIAALSRAQPRRAEEPAAIAAPRIIEIDIHLDLIAWRSGRGFIGEAAALGMLIGHLRARREGRRDAGEPTGILTHHLAQDRASEAFLRRLIAITRAHPAARWLAAGEILEGTRCPA